MPGTNFLEGYLIVVLREKGKNVRNPHEHYSENRRGDLESRNSFRGIMAGKKSQGADSRVAGGKLRERVGDLLYSSSVGEVLASCSKS